MMRARDTKSPHRGSARFAALDFIVTPEDQWTFLEANPNGQWAWIEDATGQPIAEAIAAALSKDAR
jgi:D-alanine-D-alanine ligase-like ATP-grasp enzyme